MYVTEKAYKRLKQVEKESGGDLCNLAEEAITEVFDEEGERKRASVSSEVEERLLDMAEDLRMTPSDLIAMMMDTVQVLFDPDLSFAKMIKSIPHLAEELYENRIEKEETSSQEEGE